MPNEEQLINERKKKREELLKQGINPYPYEFKITGYAKPLSEEFAKLKNEEKGKKFSVAGRVMTKRSFGAIAFTNIRDATGDIQFFFRKLHY